MQYELFYLIGGTKEANLEAIKKEMADIVISEGGVCEEKQTVEKRKLAYSIKHETHGIYVAQRFNLEDTEKSKELNRKLNLYGKILRFIISRADELPELLSKEERIAKSTSTPKSEQKKETPKEESKIEKKTEERVETPEKKSEKNEDIDKKLEEILNI